MITLRELLQQLDLRHSNEKLRSLELGIHLTCPTPVVPGATRAPREVGWHLDRLATALTNAATEVFFDDFGRYCGKLLLASLDDEGRHRLLEGGLPGAELLAKPLGRAAWVLEAEFRYGALRKGRETLKRVLVAREIETIEYLDYRRPKPWSVKKRTLAWPRRGEAPGPADRAPASLPRTSQLHHEAKEWLAEQQIVGAALHVLSGSSRFRALHLSDAMALLVGPITLGQYELAYTRAGRPIGFRSWAYLTENATTRLVDHGPRTLSAGCWNQGLRKTLICDWWSASKEDEADGPAGATIGRSSWAWDMLPDCPYAILSTARAT